MFCRLLVRLLVLAATLGTSATGRAAVLEVGPGLAFETLAAAQDHAAPGDTLRLAPGIHQDCLVVTRPGLTVEGSGPAQSSELRGHACDGKAALVVQVSGVTIRNLTLSHQRVPDGNGAGIRAEGGVLHVDHVRFIDNQDGILAGPDPAAVITVSDSEFINNGVCNPACAHGIYVGRIGLLRVERSRFFETWRAHHIKSRARQTEVIGCDIADGARGTASYAVEVEIPPGGSVLVQNNRIEKGPLAENHAGFIYLDGEIGPSVEGALRIEGNLVQFDGHYPTSFVRNLTQAPARLIGNRLPAGVQPLSGLGLVQ